MLKKNIFYLLFLMTVFLLSCEKDENDEISSGETSVVDENVASGTLQIEGLSGLNFENYSILSYEASVDLENDGEYSIQNTVEDDDVLPLLCVEDDILKFGFYPNENNRDEVSIDDILLFSFMLEPELQFKGLNEEQILSNFKSHSSYNELRELAIDLLSADKSLFNDTIFTGLVQEISNSMEDNADLKSTYPFQIQYSRNGEVILPNSNPVYCDISFEIQKDGKTVQGPDILPAKRVILSISSFVNYLIVEYSNDPDPIINTPYYIFNEEGEYTILFSNMTNNVLWSNRLQLGSVVMSYVFPIGLSRISPKNLSQECIDNVSNLLLSFADAVLNSYRLSGFQNISNLFIQAGSGLLGSISQCVDPSSIKFLDYIYRTGSIFDISKKAEDASNFVLMLRDFSSDIEEQEIRYYSDGLSFGPLTGEVLTEKDFSGPVGNVYRFSYTIKENLRYYEFNTSLISTTDVVQKDTLVRAAGLNFVAEVSNGDALVENNSGADIITDETGRIDLDLEMGTEDSKVIFKPGFSNDFIEDLSIGLSVSELLEISNGRYSVGKTSNGSNIVFLTVDFESANGNVVDPIGWFKLTDNGYYRGRSEFYSALDRGMSANDIGLVVESLSDNGKSGTISASYGSWGGDGPMPESFYGDFKMILFDLNGNSSNSLTISVP